MALTFLSPLSLISERTEHYLLANEEWKYDPIPELIDGKNIADFIDPEILEVRCRHQSAYVLVLFG